MKSSKEIRSDFINFFAAHGHRFIPSAPVVPQDDPTLLFTNAGMNQFKSIFLGDNPQKLTRAANSQKCMRVSGKHNDLEEVGRDHYHHTFFEMLGNWSFGDYYKKEAIRWGWQLLTDVWLLPKERLIVTIHASDDEAEALWKSETDIEHRRIMRFGDKSNFWEMGETGPCGPCSEIHFDIGDPSTREATFADLVAGVNGTNDRYRELWNLVFVQYNREKDGSLKPLPHTHVDTGMGFERLCAVIQGVDSNYATDLFTPIINEIARMCGKPYDRGSAGTPFRVIADHIRALTFAITDGAFPSNEGRGYVLRRLLRRAYRFGRELCFRQPFLHTLVPIVIKEMGEAFPEIGQRGSYVEEVIAAEEQRFGATLEQGIERFSLMIDNAKKGGAKSIAGNDVFTLYDTYGFPMDLTRLMAKEQGFTVDEAGYETLMAQQKTRARDARKSDDGLSPEGWTELKKVPGTEFVGYERESCTVNVCRFKITHEDWQGSHLLFVLDRTPFYAESGGQVGDRGVLCGQNGTEIRIEDTVKWNDLVVHRGVTKVPMTDAIFGKPFTATVAPELRSSTRRNHSATHLLQAALRKTLGNHIQQAGSKVEPAGLRFDFTHFKALTDEELSAVERQVNEWIMANLPVQTALQELEAAKAAGATALFGEKYGERVRVVAMDPVSKELCGGTHVSTTGNIGFFHITAETSISAGVRRIEAITGLNVAAYLARKEQTIISLTSLLKVGEPKLVERVHALIDSVKQLEERLNTLSGAQSASRLGLIFEEAKKRSGDFPWCVKNLGDMDKESFFRIADALSDTIRSNNLTTMAVVLGASVDGKALFAAGAGAEAVKKYGVHCGELVKTAAQKAGGGGGGSATRAQAGGKDPAKIDESLAMTSIMLSEKAHQQ
ncbi:MAG: alanine--tRNA ligase [Chitinispirillaceae bacterium]|nr:alanine--tRNA ligase [Chitinispirillaceae bacterium]